MDSETVVELVALPRTHPALFSANGHSSLERSREIEKIEALDRELYQRFSRLISEDASLTRQAVSFQGNKARPRYRWYKYKEAFSADLVEYFLWREAITSGKLLDPFSGMGTTLFTASSHGLDSDGIELLPIGQELIRSRLALENEVTEHDIDTMLRWSVEAPWRRSCPSGPLPELKITSGAYPSETADSINRFSVALQAETATVRSGLKLALLCVLESVSYTRKDGQYLRWDHRSKRGYGKKRFDKGDIPDFTSAVCAKIQEIVEDIRNHDGFSRQPEERGAVCLLSGSTLKILPTLPRECYSAVITSPPYCNRYDYTRTYALELALLGIDDPSINRLRQDMLTCTVENRDKDLLQMNPRWEKAIKLAREQHLLQAVLSYLEAEREAHHLNNDGIPRMVRGYFYEMSCVISECARVLRSGSKLIMVNDNVR